MNRKKTPYEEHENKIIIAIEKIVGELSDNYREQLKQSLFYVLADDYFAPEI